MSRARHRVALAALLAGCALTASALAVAQSEPPAETATSDEPPGEAATSTESPADAATTASPPAATTLPAAPFPQDALERAASSANDFCRGNGDAELSADELALCPLADAAAARCPNFRAACQKAQRPEPAAPDWTRYFALALRLLGYALYGLLLAGAAIAVGVLLTRFLRARAERTQQPEPSAPSPSASLAEPAEQALDRDVERRLSRARALAAEGAYASALAELHAAVVLKLDGRGVISARKGRTNGDYARELAEHPELRAAFKDIARAVESVQFGARSADRSLFEQTLSRAHVLVASAWPLLLAALCLALGACNGLPRLPSGAGSQCGTGADGYSFLCSLLETTGHVERRHRPLTQLGEKPLSTLVVLPSDLSDADWSAVSLWLDQAEGLLVLAAPMGPLARELELRRADEPCAGRASLEGAARGEPAFTTAPGRAMRSGELAAYARCDAGVYIAAGDYGDGKIVVMSSPAALSNAALAAGDNARLLWPLLAEQRGPVEIVGPWTGKSAESPLASLSAAGLLPWLAQLALLGLAFALYRGTPFGRRRELLEQPRRSFAEHVQALGERWAETRASRAALAAYAGWALENLRERTAAGGPAGISELSELLARRAGHDEAAVARTVVKARLAQQGGDDGASEAEHLQTMRDLARLLAETGGSR